jgi:hypothetical protein
MHWLDIHQSRLIQNAICSMAAAGATFPVSHQLRLHPDQMNVADKLAEVLITLTETYPGHHPNRK